MARELMKGTEAIAEAAVRCGCRFFAGYPITPQSEIPEYLSSRMPQVGGTFVQCESELSSISMVYGAAACGARAMTSSSGPGFSLLQEGISYIASAELPCVVVDVQRYGSGLGDIYVGQSDYWQAVKNGGHGDYRSLVIAPHSIQETVDLVPYCFEKAEEYRMPAILLTDASLGQMMEPVELPPMGEHSIDQYPWALRGKGSGPNKRHTSVMYYIEDYDRYLAEKYRLLEQSEQKWESFLTQDADLVLVSYGISSRLCREAVCRLRQEGVKAGLIRPITLYPFPAKAFTGLNPKLGFACVEMTLLHQMAGDVALAQKCRFPVYDLGCGKQLYTVEDIVRFAHQIQEGSQKEVSVL